MPGITLVVDPLTALIEDQIEGLETTVLIEPLVNFNEASKEEKDRLLKELKEENITSFYIP